MKAKTFVAKAMASLIMFLVLSSSAFFTSAVGTSAGANSIQNEGTVRFVPASAQLKMRTDIHISLSSSGWTTITMLLTISTPALIDIYRKAFEIPEAESGEEFTIMEHPAGESFVEAVTRELMLLLGSLVAVNRATIIPRSVEGDMRIFLEASSQLETRSVEKLGAEEIIEVGIGSRDSSVTSTLGSFLMGQITFAQALLRSTTQEQVFDHTWAISISLPQQAVAVNTDELSSLSWKICLGESSQMAASVSCSETLGIMIHERLTVTKAPLRKDLATLLTELGSYRVFRIRFKIPQTQTQQTQITSNTASAYLLSLNDFDFTWDRQVWSKSMEMCLSEGPIAVSLDISSNLAVAGYVGWRIDSAGLDWFRATMSATVSSDVRLEALATFEYSHTWKADLFKWSKLFAFWIGEIPVVANLEFACSLSLIFEATAELSCVVEISGQSTFTAGVSWTRDAGWSGISETTASAARIGPILSIEATASLYPTLEFQGALLFYDTAGPFIEFELSADASITKQMISTLWEVSVNLKITAGATFADWLETILDLDRWAKVLYEQTIGSWSSYDPSPPTSRLAVGGVFSPSSIGPGRLTTVSGRAQFDNGTAVPNALIEITLGRQTGSCTTDSEGKYSMQLTSPAVQGTYEAQIVATLGSLTASASSFLTVAGLCVTLETPKTALPSSQFAVTARIANYGESDVHNFKVTLAASGGLSPTRAEDSQPILAAGSSATFSWSLNAVSTGTQTLQAYVTCDEKADDSYCTTMNILEEAEIQLIIDTLSSVNAGNFFDVAVSAQNPNSYDLHEVTLSIGLPSGLTLAPGENPKVIVRTIPSEQTYVRGWEVKADSTGTKTIVVTVTCEEGASGEASRPIEVYDYQPPTKQWIGDGKVTTDSITESNPQVARNGSGCLFLAGNRLDPQTNKKIIVVYISKDQSRSWSEYCIFSLDRNYDSVCHGIAIDPYNNYIYVIQEIAYSPDHHDIVCTTIYPDKDRAYVTVADDLSGGGYYTSPSITCEHEYGSGNRVYVAYEYAESTSNRDLYVAYSTDHGQNWSKKNLHGTSDPKLYTCPSITAAEGSTYIAYVRAYDYSPDHNGNSRGSICVDVSIDRGSTWTQRENIDQLGNDGLCSRPVAAATHDGGRAIVAFSFLEYGSTESDIRYAFSKDCGTSWTGAMKIPSTSGIDGEISICADGQGTTANNVVGYFHIAYIRLDERDPMELDRGGVIYLRCYSDKIDANNWEPYYGPDWGPIDKSQFNVWAKPTTITTQLQDDGNWYPVIAWTDDRNSLSEIYAETPANASDLAVTSMQLFPAEITARTNVTLSFSIKNQGSRNASSFEVRLYVDDSCTAIWVHDHLGVAESIETSTLLRFESGDHNVSVVVDPTNCVQEIIESNTRSILTQVAAAPNAQPKIYTANAAPNPATENETVLFTGQGADADGFIVEYRWESSLNGFLSDSRVANISMLSPGTHTISLRAKDNDGSWSKPIITALVIMAVPRPPKIQDVKSDVQNAQAHSVYFIQTRNTYDSQGIGYAYGTCTNPQYLRLMDDATIVDQNSGRPIVNNKTLIIFAGPLAHKCTKYYENTNQPPLVFTQTAYGSGKWGFIKKDGTIIANASIDTNQMDGHNDLFLIETFLDSDNNFVCIMYGITQWGTLAAGPYLHDKILPSYSNYPGSWYVFKWTDGKNGEPFDSFPQPEEVTIVASSS